jgi:hypothetical protein
MQKTSTFAYCSRVPSTYQLRAQRLGDLRTKSQSSWNGMIASEWIGQSVASIKKMFARRSVFPPQRNIKAVEALASAKWLSS